MYNSYFKIEIENAQIKENLTGKEFFIFQDGEFSFCFKQYYDDAEELCKTLQSFVGKNCIFYYIDSPVFTGEIINISHREKPNKICEYWITIKTDTNKAKQTIDELYEKYWDEKGIIATYNKFDEVFNFVIKTTIKNLEKTKSDKYIIKLIKLLADTNDKFNFKNDNNCNIHRKNAKKLKALYNELKYKKEKLK